MTVQIEVPPNYRLKTINSTKLRDDLDWVSVSRTPTHRAWWKFWLPKYVYQYTVLERIQPMYYICN